MIHVGRLLHLFLLRFPCILDTDEKLANGYLLWRNLFPKPNGYAE